MGLRPAVIRGSDRPCMALISSDRTFTSKREISGWQIANVIIMVAEDGERESGKSSHDQVLGSRETRIWASEAGESEHIRRETWNLVLACTYQTTRKG